ncbi:class I SAM-dependent methyltransferase [Peribacillus sp. SCS-37]|uniref:class I SAM-dependent methyltransferase n=1 Tax=Paraperibacillus esterisolvens TaxID=3115296 RepID=UPI00390677A2
MIVTTGGRTSEACIAEAKKAAAGLGASYIERKKRPIALLKEEYNDHCLVIGRDRWELYHRQADEPFFFHPNMAMLRLKRLQNGSIDPFAEAAGLKAGMTFVDCTLGLASDSIIASWITGDEGRVIGIEENKYLAFLVEHGLKKWRGRDSSLNEAMERIQIKTGNHLDILKKLGTKSVDVVYFDPMFEETIAESSGIRPLVQFAESAPLTREAVHEAVRAAAVRVVLKDHYRSSSFEEFGFKTNKRKSAKFHYGIIEAH